MRNWHPEMSDPMIDEHYRGGSQGRRDRRAKASWAPEAAASSCFVAPNASNAAECRGADRARAAPTALPFRLRWRPDLGQLPSFVSCAVLMSARATFSSPHGTIRYDDSIDHFENGLLRLLGLDRAAFETWLQNSEQSATTDLLERLRAGFLGIRHGLTAPATEGRVEAGPLGVSGKVWHAKIAENPDFGVARSEDGAWGWLVREAGSGHGHSSVSLLSMRRVISRGTPKLAGGYGQYAAQAGWRLEKAARQLREAQTITGREARGQAPSTSAVATAISAWHSADGGFEHEGIEVSQHARNVAEHLYGFSTMAGTLDDRASELAGRYQLITLWDVIEHVADPVQLLSRVAGCLSPGGVVAIKTPNLDCPEAEIFGPYYHSLKREHLVYFTPKSLEQAAHAAGLRTVLVSSTSHLLVGFVGPAQTSTWEKAGRGADITAYFAADGLDS